MNNKLIIAVSGKAGAGKDSISDFLKEEIGQRHISCKKIGFAKTPKEICSKLLNVSEIYFHDRKLKESNIPNENMTYREYLIIVCETLREAFGRNYWAKTTLKKHYDNKNVIIISDWRFIEEIQEIKQFTNNVILIRINNKNIVSTSTHISETSLDNYDGWDYVIDNDGTLDDLKIKAISIINELKNKLI